MTAIPWAVNQVWVQGGEESMPDHIKRQVQSVRRTAEAAGARYRLWSEVDLLGSFDDIHPRLREVYDSAPSYAAKSDILRLVVLYEHGGIYLDTDMLILQVEQLRWVIGACGRTETGPSFVMTDLQLPTDDTLFGRNVAHAMRTNNCFVAASPKAEVTARLLKAIAEADTFDETQTTAGSWTMTRTGPTLYVDKVIAPLRERVGEEDWPGKEIRLVPKAVVQTVMLPQHTLELPMPELIATLRLDYPTAAVIHTEDRSWFNPTKTTVSNLGKPLSAFASYNASLLLITTALLSLAVVVMGVVIVRKRAAIFKKQRRS